MSRHCAMRPTASATTHPAAVAWWVCAPSGNRVHLCQRCLDLWFDVADDDGHEPSAWGWIPGYRPPAAGGTASRLAVVGEDGCTLVLPERTGTGQSVAVNLPTSSSELAAAIADAIRKLNTTDGT